MKHKVGDKVRVKSFDWYNANKNQTGQVQCLSDVFVEGMSKLCGKLVTINSITKHGYYIDEDDYNWSDDMFEEDMNNEIRIEVPEGYCIDEENSTFECIKFKKKECKITKHLLGVRVDTSKGGFVILDVEDLRVDGYASFKVANLQHKGATLPSKKQWKIIQEHLDEINKLLVNKIKETYWTSDLKDSANQWTVYMNYGYSYIISLRNNTGRVRPILNY